MEQGKKPNYFLFTGNYGLARMAILSGSYMLIGRVPTRVGSSAPLGHALKNEEAVKRDKSAGVRLKRKRYRFCE
jgi:hypothetical protein